MVKRLLPVAKLKGDAERGKVGPELAGIGARDRADILMEILDLSGTKHSVQRKDIASLESSPLSTMPTGFEQIPESDLAGLLEYLAHSNHPPGK